MHVSAYGVEMTGIEEDGAKERLKRQACAIVAQLPDDRRDALLVLSYASDILQNLGRETWEPQTRITRVCLQRMEVVR